jgi:hypothetical protein
MKLKRGLRVLWRSPDEVQIGDDPRFAKKIHLDHPAEYHVLKALETDQTPAKLRRILTDAHAPRERANELLKEVARAGMLGPSNSGATAQFDVEPRLREYLASEAESRSLLEKDGWVPVAMRGHQRVSVYGLGRTGARTVLGLVEAGVGLIQITDQRLVGHRDLGTVYGPQDLGMPRDKALARIVRSMANAVEVRVQGRWAQPDAAVLVDYEVADPTRGAFLTGHRIPHLSVVVGEVSITCGPWVPDKGGPCERCVDLSRAEADPCWPGMAAQQHARSVVAGRGEDPCLAALAGSFAVSQVLTDLAGGKPETLGRTKRLSLPDYRPTWTDVSVHPGCTQHNPRRRGPSLR